MVARLHQVADREDVKSLDLCKLYDLPAVFFVRRLGFTHVHNQLGFEHRADHGQLPTHMFKSKLRQRVKNLLRLIRVLELPELEHLLLKSGRGLKDAVWTWLGGVESLVIYLAKRLSKSFLVVSLKPIQHFS